MIADDKPTLVAEKVESRANQLPQRWLELTDEAFLADCHFEAFRGPGPGGQKRNKTSNCIRLTHMPTGLHVIAGESRSQSENKSRAVRRMKLKIATEFRHAIDPRGFEPPDWFAAVKMLGRIAVSHHNVNYARTAELTLNLLEARNGSIGDVGKLLGVTTSSVAKFLMDDPHIRTAANHIRKTSGLPTLTA
jgi:hypothetical protein